MIAFVGGVHCIVSVTVSSINYINFLIPVLIMRILSSGFGLSFFPKKESKKVKRDDPDKVIPF